jgi:hypothetical protein
MTPRILLAFASALLASCATPEAPKPVAAAGVRAPSGCVPERFAVRGGEILDMHTRLTWRRCPAGQDFGGASCTGNIYATERLDNARRAADAEKRRTNQGWRLPGIDEVSAIAGKACAPLFGRALPALSGPPIWTGTSAGAGKVYQFDPGAGGRTAEKENDAPGIVFLVRE